MCRRSIVVAYFILAYRLYFRNTLYRRNSVKFFFFTVTKLALWNAKCKYSSKGISYDFPFYEFWIYVRYERVYCAPREEKTWTIHISYKLWLMEVVGKREMWAGQFYSRGAYTIFHHTQAENSIFAFLSRERKWHFRPGYGENNFFLRNLIHFHHTFPRFKTTVHLLLASVAIASSVSLSRDSILIRFAVIM